MQEKIKKLIYRLEGNFLLTAIRHGLVMMMPFILVGGIACALVNLPIAGYQEFITGETFGWIGSILNNIYTGTFGCFSFVLVVALSMGFAMEKNETIDQVAMYVIVAVASYGVQINIGTDHFDVENIGITGSFLAIVVALISCALFSKLKRIRIFSLREYTSGMETICANAIQAWIPAMLIVGFFAVGSKALTTFFGVYSLQELISDTLCLCFQNAEAGFLSGLAYTVLLHVLWILGIHGSHVLEPVAQNNFALQQSGQIFSKNMFDTYVVMGGCGTTICVLLVLLLFFRKDRMGRLAHIAAPTVIFNLNEVLNFGIPIVLNPVLAIPFVCTPVVCYILSYVSTYVGLVPPVTKAINWSAPIIFSGYLATGSIRGSILQIVCVAIGVAIYFPFLKLHKRVQEAYAKEQLKDLVEELKMLEEENEAPKLLLRTDRLGLVSRMLLQDLKTAIKNRELFLLYQPQIDSDNVCSGAEALLRWNHPVYGFIYPPLIIYLAKEGDLLPKLEGLLFDMACSAIRTTQEQFDGDFKISVNITAKSLLWDIESCIDKTLHKYQIPPEKLWIEITEQDVIANSSMVVDKLSRLKKVGHTLLIDDFGMGHTSLLYLQSNYFNVVKLDGSLVKKLLKSNTNQKIISSIVKLGSELDVDVIAEYVETELQKEKLLELGCKRYQGYLFSKPVGLDEFIAYLKGHRGEKNTEK